MPSNIGPNGPVPLNAEAYVMPDLTARLAIALAGGDEGRDERVRGALLAANLYARGAPPTPVVTISGAQARFEGNGATVDYVYTVTRTDTSSAVSVPWSFTPGSTSANDFSGGAYPTGGTVIMGAGVSNGTFVITVSGDLVVESDETFTVSISPPAGYVAGSPSSATGTILNDDVSSSPTVSISAAQSILEGNTGTKLFTYTVTRSISTGTIAVPWTFAPGTTSASDFSGGNFPTGGSVAILDGQTTGTIAITTASDVTVEPDETFTISITAPSGYSLGGNSSATGTIVNDDVGGGYADPDLNIAYAFKQKILSYDQGSGDRAAQLFAAFPDLKAYLNVGNKLGSLAAGSTHPNWNASASRLDVPNGVTAVAGYDFQGSIYIGGSVANDLVVTNCLIRAKPDGTETSYKVQKQNSDTDYLVTVRDCTLRNGQAVDPKRFLVERVLSEFSEADHFKLGSTGGPTRPQRIINSWGQACGYNNPGAHGDGSQASTTGDYRVVAVGFHSSPVFNSAEVSTKYTGPYSTNSYGLTNSIRIDSSGGARLVERGHYLGILSAFGSIYPVGITAQRTDSITRNITIALSVFAPSAFRYDGMPDSRQIHPSLTYFADGGGKMENIAFLGNVVFGGGPVLYSDRGAAAASVDGIWHWNPTTLDSDTLALWKDLGLLTSAGVPAPGMLRSVAGTIAIQAKTVPTSGVGGLGIDVSSIPNNTPVIIHLANGAPDLEYIA